MAVTIGVAVDGVVVSNATITELLGYIYSKSGKFLEKRGTSKNVYSAEKYTKDKDGKYSYTETPKNLPITHSDFCYIAGILYILISKYLQ
jgi:hypothetical protein